jgi:hypothetical protein
MKQAYIIWAAEHDEIAWMVKKLVGMINGG